MKSFKGTFFFALLVVLVGAFAIYDYKSNQTKEAADVEAKKTFAEMDFDQLTSLRYEGFVGSFEFRNTEEGWRSVLPVEDLADESALSDFVMGLSNRPLRRVDVQPPVDWQKFGLKKPQAIIRFNGKEGSQSIAISTEKSFDDGYYIRRNNTDELFLGNREWSADIKRTAKDFRNKEIWFYGTSIERLRLRSGKERIDLQKVDGNWVDKKRSDILFDQMAVNDLIDDIRTLKMDSIVAEKITKKLRRENKLSVPAMSIQMDYQDVKNKEKSLWKAEFGKEHEGNAYVTTNKLQPLYKVLNSKLNKLRKTYNDLRDKTQPHKVNLAQIAKAEVKHNGQVVEVQSSRLTPLLNELKSVKVANFTGAKAKGMHKNFIRAFGEDGKQVFKLQWGDEFEFDGAKYVAARSSLMKGTYMLNKSDADKLKNFKITEDKPQAETSDLLPNTKGNQ